MDCAIGCAGSVLRVLNDSCFVDLRGYCSQLSSHASTTAQNKNLLQKFRTELREATSYTVPVQNTGDHESESEGSATDIPSKSEMHVHPSSFGKER